MSSIAFFLIVLHISAYFIRYLSSPFSTISRRFVIRARVGGDIFDFSGVLIDLAIFDAPYCCKVILSINILCWY